MNSKKTLLMFLGLISGMIFVYSLDVLTTKIPASLQYHFKSWRVLRYEVTAKIDNLTVLEREGRNIPVRYIYSEEMQLNCYFYHMKQTGKRMVMMELVSTKIVPERIEVAGKDETAKMGPGFAMRVPPPGYVFLEFDEYGLIPGQRRGATIRDMIVSTYHVRSVKKGRSMTSDVWEGQEDMGPFITTYKWQFDNVTFDDDRNQLALVSGGGDFLAELPDGGKGKKLGSYTYSYKLGLSTKNRFKGFIRSAEGSFDIESQYTNMSTSYREEFLQKIRADETILRQKRDIFRNELENLQEVMGFEMSGDTQAFHDGLVIHLRAYPESPLWNNLFALLNGLREKCSEEPFTKNDILKDDAEKEDEKKEDSE